MNRERLVTIAISLMLISVCIGFVNTTMNWSNSVDQFGVLNSLLIFSIPTLLYLSLLFTVSKQFNWARIVLLVLIFLALPGYVISIFGDISILEKTVQIIQLVLNASGVMLLLHPKSKAWFKYEKCA